MSIRTPDIPPPGRPMPLFQLHSLFARVERSRFGTGSDGQCDESWRRHDRFEIAQGEPGGLILFYSSKKRENSESAQGRLANRKYTELLAGGRIETSAQLWIFDFPNDVDVCGKIVRNAVNDPLYLRHYGEFMIVWPNGEKAGKAKTFLFPDEFTF